MIGALNVVRSGRTSVILLMLAALTGCGGGSDGSTPTSSTAPVGGKVAGLNGSITLSNNGGDLLILNTDTAYRFAREVTRGVGYQVAVDSKPSDQLCTVSNAIGVVSGEVRNVDISCITPPQYSVGGTVTGLVGSLKLRNNGGDEITLTADGAYTFPSTIMSTTAYQVTLYDEAANQDCTVSNGTGTISGTVVNVNVSCTTDSWAHPANLAAQLTSPLGQGQINPRVAMDSNGNAIAVWQQSDGFNTQIFKSEYRGGTWIHPANLADNISPDGTDAVSPRVALGRNGTADDAVIIWTQWNGLNTAARRQLYLSEYRSGGWTHPANLGAFFNPPGSQTYEDPAVAMDDNGNTIVVWRQLDGPTPTVDFPQLYMREYRAGTWSTLTGLSDRFSQSNNEVRFSPDVAMSNNGEAVVVWRQYSGFTTGRFLVYKREFRAGGWTAEPDVITDSLSPRISGNATGPKVAMDNNGNAIIAWEQTVSEAQPHPYFPSSDPADDPVEINHIFKSEYRGGSWSNPVNQLDNISPSGLHATNPRVAMDDSGSALITWVQSDANDLQLFKSEYRGGTWTHPTSLTDNISPDNESVASADVAMDNLGNAIIAWRQFDGNRYMIYKSEYRNSTLAWRHPVSLLDAINPGSRSAVTTGPDVVMDDVGAGGALILWSQSDAEDATGVQQIFQSELR